MIDLILSADQEVGVDMVTRFLDQDDHRVAVLSGYAGTGKTTISRVLADLFGVPVVVTPTGKAAQRVKEAAGLDASTIHRFLYTAEDDPATGEPVFNLRDANELHSYIDDAPFILVDEASMVDPKVWADLVRAAEVADTKLLLMGDRFQLPPVQKPGSAPFCAMDYPTPFKVNMTEVVRQALDSPIVRASMLIRAGKPDFAAMALLDAVPASKLIRTVIDFRERGGAVLVHRNKTRHSLNDRVRKELGYELGTVNLGEPLLVMANSYPLNRYNGEVVTFEGWLDEPTERTTKPILDRYTQGVLNMPFGIGRVEGTTAMLSPADITGRAEELRIAVRFIKRGARQAFRESFAVYEEENGPPYLSANYGYALTTHKSQGSEWPEVLVVIEPSLNAMGPTERRRWLYTAITRGKTKVSYLYLKE